jgi:branched-chain amino acid transport system substrate-binding protein
MSNRLRFARLALLCALVVILAACGSKSTSNAPRGTQQPTGSPAAHRPTVEPGSIVTSDDVLRKDPNVTKQDEITWGWMFEMSGPLQGFGEPAGDGVKFAVQEINDAGGFQVGDTIYKIKLDEHDTQTNIAQTLAIATELVQDKHVKVIWGPASAGEPEATAYTQNAHVIHICPCQNRETDSLSTVEKAQGQSHWAFETLPPVGPLTEQGAATFSRDYPGFTSFAILCVNTEVGKDICGHAKKAYLDAGLTLTGEEYFPPQTADYSAYLSNLKSGDPDFLFNFDDPPNQATIIRQALEQGVGRLHIAQLPADLIGPLVGRELTAPVIAGAVPRQNVQPTSDKARLYFERYKAYRKGKFPLAPFVSLLTYDYVYMLVAAMQQAGTVDDTTAIADALEQLHYNGVGEDDMYFNSHHFGVMGTDPCLVRGEEITCHHVPPPDSLLE